MSNEERVSRIQWQPIIELGIVLFTVLGSTIPLYLHTDSKINAMYANIDTMRKETNDMVLAIHQEIKDFHGKMCAIEEKHKHESKHTLNSWDQFETTTQYNARLAKEGK